MLPLISLCCFPPDECCCDQCLLSVPLCCEDYCHIHILWDSLIKEVWQRRVGTSCGPQPLWYQLVSENLYRNAMLFCTVCDGWPCLVKTTNSSTSRKSMNFIKIPWKCSALTVSSKNIRPIALCWETAHKFHDKDAGS